MFENEPLEPRESRRERGRGLRKTVPRRSHAEWTPAPDRSDPVALLEAQDEGRVPDLVPVRHARMSVSPFTFYRGGAKIMAADLALTPDIGVNAQICGDAHLSNFGVFASPERQTLFDCNDFDETLAGPWEWDVKRLAASLVIAGRNNGLGKSDTETITLGAVDRYRRAIREFAEMSMLELWYQHLTTDELAQLGTGSKDLARFEKQVAKARRRTSLRAFEKLTETVDGSPRFRSDPPLLVPLRELDLAAEGFESADEVSALVLDQFEAYQSTIPDDLRVLLGHYRLVDLARKVVGVGSVGTRCYVALLLGGAGEPFILQVKEAVASVLEDHLPASPYPNHGQRVVEGQRLMQATGDIFLGWTETDRGHHYYWRQLKDMKGSAEIETMNRTRMARYAAVCGWTLARAHAKSGDAVVIGSYLGAGDRFDRSISTFAHRYADQNEADYALFVDAIASGRIEAEAG